jgi:hypothetical protein
MDGSWWLFSVSRKKKQGLKKCGGKKSEALKFENASPREAS